MALSGTETGHGSGENQNHGVKDTVKKHLSKIGIRFNEKPQPPPRADLASVDGYPGTPGGPESKHRAPSGQEIKLQNREHDISTELARRLTNNVREELNKMIFLQRTKGDEAFRDMYIKSNHKYLLRLFDEFTEDAGEGRKIKNEFNTYMTSEPGLIKAGEVTKRKLQDLLRAQASIVRTLPNVPQAGLVQEGNVVVGGNEGPLRKAAREVHNWGSHRYGGRRQNAPPPGAGRVRTGLNAARNAVGTAREFITPQTRGGRLATGVGIAGVLAAVNPLVGLGAAGAEAAAAGVARGLRQGQRLETVRSKNAIVSVTGSDGLRGNRYELEYMQEHLLVDPNDIDISTGRVQMRTEGYRGTRLDSETLGEFINGYSKDIIELQRALKIPERQIDPMDNRWLIDGSAPPQQGTVMQYRILERFRHMPGGGLRTSTGGTMETYNASRRDWIFTGGNPDIQGNVRRWNEVADAIMCEDMDHDFQRTLNDPTRRPDNLLTLVTHRESEQGPDSHAARHLIETNQEQIQRLNAVTELLNTNLTNLTGFETVVEQKQHTLQQAEQQLRELERRIEIIDPVPPPSGYTTPTRREALRRILTDRTTPFEIRIGNEVIGSIRQERTDIDGDIRTTIDAVGTPYETWSRSTIDPQIAAQRAILSPGTASDEQVNRANQRIAQLEQQRQDYRNELIKVQFGTEIEANNAHRKLVEETRVALENAITEGDNARTALTRRDNAERRTSEQTMTSLEEARTRITGFHTDADVRAAGIDLDDNALQTQTLTELERRINDAYTRVRAAGRLGVGWPERDNERNRAELIRAMTEAQAGRIEPSLLTGTSAEFQALIDPATFDFAELDIISLTDDQLLQEMMARQGRAVAGSPLAGATLLTAAEIANVRQEAQRRLNARRTALVELAERFEPLTRQLTEANERIQREGVQSPQLQVIRRIGERIANDNKIAQEIMSLSHDEIARRLNPNATVAYTPTGTPVGLPGYNAEEQNAAYSEGYVHILRWLVDSVHDTEAEYTGPGTGRPAAERGQNAAFRRAADYLTPAVIDAQLRAWQPHRTPPLSLVNLRTDFEARRISKQQLVDFLTNGIGLGYLQQRVNTAA